MFEHQKDGPSLVFEHQKDGPTGIDWHRQQPEPTGINRSRQDGLLAPPWLINPPWTAYQLSNGAQWDGLLAA